MADKCDPLRSRLHDLEEKLKKTDKFLNEKTPGEKHSPKAKLSPADCALRVRLY